MTFQELRQLLRQLGRDPLSVVYAKYDTPADAARAPLERWVIWEHDAIFDVGGEERGRFVSTQRFETEEAACDYLAGVLGGPRIVHQQTDDERARSKAITEAHRARIRARLAEAAEEKD